MSMLEAYTCLSVCLSIYLFIYRSTYLPTYLSVYLSQSLCLCLYLNVHISGSPRIISHPCTDKPTTLHPKSCTKRTNIGASMYSNPQLIYRSPQKEAWNAQQPAPKGLPEDSNVAPFWVVYYAAAPNSPQKAPFTYFKPQSKW